MLDRIDLLVCDMAGTTVEEGGLLEQRAQREAAREVRQHLQNARGPGLTVAL